MGNEVMMERGTLSAPYTAIAVLALRVSGIGQTFGNIAPLLSMSLRLYGNNVSGTIIMQLLYTLGNNISNFFWSVFGLKDIFNFVGPIIAAPLHCYFDLFSGFIQMYIFIMLTMVLVGNTIPEDQRD